MVGLYYEVEGFGYIIIDLLSEDSLELKKKKKPSMFSEAIPANQGLHGHNNNS